MRLAEMLPARLRKLAPEAVKFAVVGGVNTVINFVVLNALILTVLANGELKAKIIATVVATITSYLMNRHWTYGDRPKSAMHREFVLFVFFNAAGLAIELAVMGATKYGLNMTGWLAINAAAFIGLALGTLFRFFTYRTFVFAKAPADITPVTPDGIDIDLGPLHVHVDTLDELRDAEAAASALAGVPLTAHRAHAASAANEAAIAQAADQDTDVNQPRNVAHDTAEGIDVDLNSELDAALAADLAATLRAAEREATALAAPKSPTPKH